MREKDDRGTRETPLANPTAERTAADQSTQSASGLTGGEERGSPEPDEDEVGPYATPRRYDELPPEGGSHGRR